MARRFWNADQRGHIFRLQCEEPIIKAKLRCPKCGASMKLKLGRHGRFYGCSKWKRIGGCNGTITALDNGHPCGGTLKERWQREDRKRRPPRTCWQRILDDEFDSGIQEQPT